MSQRVVCFAVMPFRPELNFFFLYLRHYLADRHNIEVERGDSAILTRAIMDKIREQISSASVIIGDITGGNPNVFYELGLAHAFGKPIIFLTQDDPRSAPVDIRQFEFIHYDLSRHEDFLAKLDNAIKNVFAERYRKLHERAKELLVAFNTATGSKARPATLDEFRARVVRGEQAEALPTVEDEIGFARFMLPKIMLDPTDLTTMRSVTKWLVDEFPENR